MSETHVPTRRRGAVKFPPEVLEAIPRWRAMGATPGEIAQVIGTTVNALRARCSQTGVSLDEPLSRRFTPEQWSALGAESKRRGTSPARLVALVVAAVVDEGLFSAVLGDYDDLEGEE